MGDVTAPRRRVLEALRQRPQSAHELTPLITEPVDPVKVRRRVAWCLSHLRRYGWVTYVENDPDGRLMLTVAGKEALRRAR